jgi:hypothetical protein
MTELLYWIDRVMRMIYWTWMLRVLMQNQILILQIHLNFFSCVVL